jgi:hypothetical protein
MVFLRQRNKKGEQSISTLGKIILVVIFLILMVVIFFGNGLIPKAFDKIREKIRGVPEVDPTKNELDFHRNMDKQILFFTGVTRSLEKAAASKDQPFCFVELPAMDQTGFYDGNFNLYIDKTADDTELRLTETKSQNYEDKKTQGTDTPVSATVIKGIQPCVIRGEATVAEFYKQFNDRVSLTPDPVIGSITPTPVSSILLSSSKTDSEIRQIGYKLTDTYVWDPLFKKKDRTLVYVLKMTTVKGDYMCFFPADKTHWWESGCGSPPGDFVDMDCFDSDAGKKSLKYNFDNNLLDKKYMCNGGSATGEIALFAKALSDCADMQDAKVSCICKTPALSVVKNVQISTGTIKDSISDATVQTKLTVVAGSNYQSIGVDTTKAQELMITNQNTVSAASAGVKACTQ